MGVAASTADPFDEGYPPSSEGDLDPGPDLNESLDDADRMASDEHRLVPEGQQADQSTDDEGRFEDIDHAESRH